ncbi:hypothetical protein HYD71_02335 [Mycoplasmopsis bovis]|nr:hypothetical protein [Mycoplasmopsis bovis]QQH49547.1 hypothetical protein HYD71_02335 [Mycoplasmopsis bovis]
MLKKRTVPTKYIDKNGKEISEWQIENLSNIDATVITKIGFHSITKYVIRVLIITKKY